MLFPKSTRSAVRRTNEIFKRSHEYQRWHSDPGAQEEAFKREEVGEWLVTLCHTIRRFPCPWALHENTVPNHHIIYLSYLNLVSRGSPGIIPFQELGRTVVTLLRKGCRNPEPGWVDSSSSRDWTVTSEQAHESREGRQRMFQGFSSWSHYLPFVEIVAFDRDNECWPIWASFSVC